MFGITIISLILAMAVILFVGRNRPVTLSISVQPLNSSVYINEKLVGQGNIKINLEPEGYLIKVRKDGFFEESRQIFLRRPTTININLVEIPSTTIKNIIDISQSPNIAVTDENTIFTIDQDSNFLMKMDLKTKQKTPISLPNSPTVNSLSVLNDSIVIETEAFPSINPHRYFVLNLKNESISELNIDTLQPFIALSKSKNNNLYAILGKYDIYTDTASLFIGDSLSHEFKEISSQLAADSLLWINDNKILIIDTKDPDRFNGSSIFDINTKTSTPFISPPQTMKNPVVNPNLSVIAYLKDGDLVITNVETSDSKILLKNQDENSIFWWFDNNNILVVDKTRELLQKINTDSLSVSDTVPIPSRPGKTLISVITIKNNQLGFIFSNDSGTAVELALP